MQDCGYAKYGQAWEEIQLNFRYKNVTNNWAIRNFLVTNLAF
jgi:hypothetical protein